ncbi:MAG: amidohydrolase [Propionibacteriaceae bacterium]|nr:amidohydrolase [Propionibacteriaceae bacterium]
MRITDSQVHLWAPQTPERVWSAPSVAPRPSHLVSELIAQMDATGVDRAVLVPPSFEGYRNDYCLSAVQDYPGRFAVMGRLRLDAPGTKALQTWKEQPGMLGLRITAFRKADAEALADLAWLWQGMAAADLPAMLFAPGQYQAIAALAKANPQVKFTLDHLCLPTTAQDDELDPLIDQVCQLAGYENIAVKASCLANNVTDSFPFPSLHDRIHKVMDAYGLERVFWGSDLSRSRISYRESLALFTEQLPFLGDSELEWVLDRGISTWLGWS